jgi:predicted SAM-dependent methyltransferase
MNGSSKLSPMNASQDADHAPRVNAPSTSGIEWTSDHLHLGCGLHSPPGWLHVDGSWKAVLARFPVLKQLLESVHVLPRRPADRQWRRNVVRLNLNSPLPFEANHFQAVYSSHTLEHLFQEDARRLLGECLRVLKPGGMCRIVVPDLRSFVEAYLDAKGRGEADAADRLMEQLRTRPRAQPRGLLGAYYRLTGLHDHKWMYDQESLSTLFREVGFVDVAPRPYLDSDIARIGEIEDPGRILNGEGIAVEGRKPSVAQQRET